MKTEIRGWPFLIFVGLCILAGIVSIVRAVPDVSGDIVFSLVIISLGVFVITIPMSDGMNFLFHSVFAPSQEIWKESKSWKICAYLRSGNRKSKITCPHTVHLTEREMILEYGTFFLTFLEHYPYSDIDYVAHCTFSRITEDVPSTNIHFKKETRRIRKTVRFPDTQNSDKFFEVIATHGIRVAPEAEQLMVL